MCYFLHSVIPDFNRRKLKKKKKKIKKIVSYKAYFHATELIFELLAH